MEPAPTVSAVHGFLLPTDFQALSFTSPQWPAKPVTHDERGNASRRDETRMHSVRLPARLTPELAESQKTKCPRQRVTQAFRGGPG
jgi:hypothetical protein